MRRRHTSALALGRDGSDRYLPWTIGLKAFFAALAIATLVALDHAVARWQSGAFAVVTVELPAEVGEAALAAAIEAMRRTLGVESAQLLPRAAVAGLVEPWLGAGNLPDDLPLPVLIDVHVMPGAVVDWEEARERLGEDAPQAVLDTGMAWIESLIDLARLAQLVAAVTLAFVTAVAVLTVIFATRAALAVHGSTVELLHLLGARDRYIASQFQRHAMWLGLRGGIGGLLPALATLFALGYAGGKLDAPLLPELAIGPGGWLALALVPVSIALLAMVTARYTVLRVLARLP
jgi:cell division transport system permease protein